MASAKSCTVIIHKSRTPGSRCSFCCCLSRRQVWMFRSLPLRCLCPATPWTGPAVLHSSVSLPCTASDRSATAVACYCLHKSGLLAVGYHCPVGRLGEWRQDCGRVRSSFHVWHRTQRVLLPPRHDRPVSLPVGLWTILFQNWGRFSGLWIRNGTFLCVPILSIMGIF